jgi:FkbM family methyltransferase
MKSSLGRSFQKTPLGFVDIGAAGGAHELVLPAASVTHCTCFEPGEESYQALLRQLEASSPFAESTVFKTAISGRQGKASLNLTQSAVNTSLLKPQQELISRYGKAGFRVKQTVPVQTQTLDGVLFAKKSNNPSCEILKLDCQGADYSILEGSPKTVQQCTALLCEAMFFPMYKQQKIFSEIDLLLRKKGFQLYGLYPNYISTQKLDRTMYDSEERIVWADAVYFRDPFAERSVPARLKPRQVESLLLATLLFRFYDFSLEIIEEFYKKQPAERKRLKELVLSLAADGKASLVKETAAFSQRLGEMPDKAYVLARKFMDKNRSNTNLDNIKI